MQWIKASVRLAAAGVLGVLLAAPARADEVTDAEKQITEALAKIKSVSYKMAVTQDMEMQGMTLKSNSTATVQAIHAGDKWKQRLEMETAATQGAAGQETKSNSKTLAIYDGEFSYILTEAEGQKMAYKNKPEAATNPSPFDGKALFAAMRDAYNIKRLPDAKVGDRDCIVLEMTFKDAAAMAASPMTKMTTSICKKTGIQVKSEALNAQGKVTQSSTLTEIKLDDDIKQDRFEFKAPEGVNLVDTTKQP